MTDGYELRDLGPRDCRFPVTAHDVTPHRFCGERALPGTAWCAAHYRVVFIRRAPKEKKTGGHFALTDIRGARHA